MAVAEAAVAPGELRRDPDEALGRVAAGDELVWVRAGRQRFLLVNGADAAREALLERAEELVKPRSQAIRLDKAQPERADGRLSPALLRRALSKGMGSDRAAETAEALVVEAQAATAAWRDGEAVGLVPWLRPLVVRAVVRGPFASSLADDDFARLGSVVRWASRTPRVETRGPTAHGLERPLALARLAQVARTVLANADLERPSESRALLLESEQFAPSLTDAERQALAGELLLGAAGPLLQSGGWALLRLGTEPEATARLREEWEAGTDRLWTDAFVREVTRLHPTNPRITRVAVADTTVAGEPVPADARVVVNVTALHRDPLVYPEPERFLPERWLGGRLPEHRFSYAAFGIGDRRCLGEAIATRALAALVEAVGRDWDLEFGEVGVAARGRRQLADEAVVTVRRRRAP